MLDTTRMNYHRKRNLPRATPAIRRRRECVRRKAAEKNQNPFTHASQTQAIPKEVRKVLKIDLRNLLLSFHVILSVAERNEVEFGEVEESQAVHL
jgi:hypothetical protein